MFEFGHYTQSVLHLMEVHKRFIDLPWAFISSCLYSSINRTCLLKNGGCGRWVAKSSSGGEGGKERGGKREGEVGVSNFLFIKVGPTHSEIILIKSQVVF